MCLGKVTVEEISDEVLLRIFRVFLDSSPQLWPTLMHICRKWRHLVFASHRALCIRLLCTHGAPVLKSLDCWPALPIALEYGGFPEIKPPVPEDEENILAALNPSGRVNSIRLTLTKTLLKRLSSLEGQLSALEELVLFSPSGTLLTLPRTFRWGPRLRRLHSTRVAFSAPLRLLSSSRDLVDIHLTDFDHRLLSPKALADALSGTHIKSLSLHVLSRDNHQTMPPPLKKRVGKRVVTSSLSSLKYQGTSEYLGSLLKQLDAPRLADIELTFINDVGFNEIRSSVASLRKFTDRTEIWKPRRRAEILFSESSASLSLRRSPTTCLKFQVFCKPFNKQVISLAQICSQLCPLKHLEEIRIKITPSSSLYRTKLENWNSETCLNELLSSFGEVKSYGVASDSELSTNIRRPSLLPEGLSVITKLCVCKLGSRFPPLREAVVSLMAQCRFSCHPLEVEYEQLCIDELDEVGAGPFSPRVTIEMLSDDILVNIFRHYVDDGPQYWPILAHVCQLWRRIVFGSPLSLDLRLYCTYGTPVLKTLGIWPPLPLIVNYGGSHGLKLPAPNDEENIVAALKQSDLVRSIDLNLTSELVEKLSTISEPLTELQELTLLVHCTQLTLTLPRTFRWGPQLRTLHLTRISIPTLPQLLSLATSLVELKLHGIHRQGFFCPEAFANALSGTTHLKTISLHFFSLPPRRNYLSLSPAGVSERTVLPALTCLKYQGTSRFLDSFVARIDAPCLEDINISLSNQPTMDAFQLGRFLERTEMQISLLQADVYIDPHAISISFTNTGTSTPLRITIPCKQLDWKLSSIAQVCGQCSPFLLRLSNLGIDTTQLSSGQGGDVDNEQCLALLRPFGGARSVWVTGELTTDGVLDALGKVDSDATAAFLPDLRHLRVGKPLAVYGPSWDGVQSFLVCRWIGGRPVQINAPSYLCHICLGTFEMKEELRDHLLLKHAYLIVCSYCVDFRYLHVPEYDPLIRDHLASEHVIVPPTNMLRASDLLELFTKVKPSVSSDETCASTDASTDYGTDYGTDLE